MIIGDWLVDDFGMIEHLKCESPARSWGHFHQCWIPGQFGVFASTGHPKGHYIDTTIPNFVLEVSNIQYTIWKASTDGDF